MTEELHIRPPTITDGAAMWRLAGAAAELDVNSSYAYLLWCRDFGSTSVVAAPGGPGGEGAGVAAELAGFITGYRRPEDRDVLLVWQVAVSPRFRRRGVARRMLDELVAVMVGFGGSFIETTVTPGNAASRAMFASLAGAHEAAMSEEPLFEAGHFPDPHEPERLIRIGPFN